MISKRGLSGVIATVLLILLALAASTLLWAFLRPMFSNASDRIQTQTQCIDTELLPMNCQISGTGPYTVTTRIKHSKGDISSIRAVLSFADGSKQTKDANDPGILSSAQIIFTNIAAQPQTLAAAGVVIEKTNKNFACEQISTEIPCVITENLNAVCNDGQITPPEVCDGNNLNGQTCKTQHGDYTYDLDNFLSCNQNCNGFNTQGCISCEETVNRLNVCGGYNPFGQFNCTLNTCNIGHACFWDEINKCYGCGTKESVTKCSDFTKFGGKSSCEKSPNQCQDIPGYGNNKCLWNTNSNSCIGCKEDIKTCGDFAKFGSGAQGNCTAVPNICGLSCQWCTNPGACIGSNLNCPPPQQNDNDGGTQQ